MKVVRKDIETIGDIILAFGVVSLGLCITISVGTTFDPNMAKYPIFAYKILPYFTIPIAIGVILKVIGIMVKND